MKDNSITIKNMKMEFSKIKINEFGSKIFLIDVGGET